MNTDEALAVRLRLFEGGYSPLPLNGKNPDINGKGWQEKRLQTNETEIRLWSKLYQHYNNTGILNKYCPALDADILNPEAAEAVEAMVRERFEELGVFLVRIGLAPKRAILFRTDEPFAKITAKLVAPNGSEERIEFLGNGEQLACFGIHPITKQPYRWPCGEPGQIPREGLPYIREAEAQKLVDDIAELLIREFGYRRKTEAKDKGNGKDQGGERGPYDWDKFGDLLDHDNLTSVAMALIRGGLGKDATYNLLRNRIEAIETQTQNASSAASTSCAPSSIAPLH
jgi:hypothetical protein